MSDAPRLLLLDTSGRGGVVALARGQTLLGEHRLDESRRHARDLAPLTADLLGRQGWKARQLDGVVVSLGPGSYTGLRVGLIAAKSLAYAAGCALLGVETFAAIAEQAPAEANLVDVLADAQKEKVYVQGFYREADRMSSTGPLRIVPLAEWLAGRDPLAWVSGPGVAACGGRLDGLNVVESRFRSPGAEALLRLGLRRLRQGERDDLWALEPIYLRPSSAEEQWQGR